MRLIIKDRNKGKTTGLIHTSEATGYPIITYNMTRVQHINDLAKELGCKIPEPITMYEVEKNEVKMRNMSHVLIDNAELMIKGALKKMIGCEVMSATISADTEETVVCNL